MSIKFELMWMINPFLWGAQSSICITLLHRREIGFKIAGYKDENIKCMIND